MKKEIMKIQTIVVVFLGLTFALSPPVQAQTTNAEETLKQYVAELQTNPSDKALREKIIKLAVEMNPSPETPAEARKYMARGIAAFKGAKTEADFKDAAEEFAKALNIAPWLANGYRDLAIARDKTGQYDRALSNLKWYLLTKPAPADVVWAEDLKAQIEYRKEKAAKEGQVAAQKQSEEASAKAEADAAAARQKAEEERAVLELLQGQWAVDFTDPAGYPTRDITSLRVIGRTVEKRDETITSRGTTMNCPWRDWVTFGTIDGHTLNFSDGSSCQIQVKQRSFTYGAHGTTYTCTKQ